MTPQPKPDEQPFAVVFESLRAAQAARPETALIRLMMIADEAEPEWEQFDELRRLSESMVEPEARTLPAS